MTEINDGLVLPLSRVLNEQLTYRGKEIKFELIDDKNQVYKGSTNLSEEEKKHNRDVEFIYSLAEASGTIIANLVPLKNNDPEFDNLTDSERITKANSLTYQTRQPEPTDLGNKFNPTLDKAVMESSHNKKPEQSQQEKESEKSAKPSTSTSTTSKSKKEDDDIGDFKLTGSGNLKKD